MLTPAMPDLIPVKLISRLLLIVMLTFTVSSAYDSAHAMQGKVEVAGYHETGSQVAVSHQCPCCPQQQSDSDGCDLCCDCACHTLCCLQHFSFDRKLFLSELQSYDRFTYLPEVFLTKFVPPQL